MKSVIFAIVSSLFVSCAHSTNPTRRDLAQESVADSLDNALKRSGLVSLVRIDIPETQFLERDEVLMNEEGEAGIAVVHIMNGSKEVLGSIIYFVGCDSTQDPSGNLEIFCQPLGSVLKKR